VLEPSRILGAGGFGVAFLCHDRARGDTVVVKALAADLGAEEVNRLWDEVRVLAGLTHPAVLRPLGGGYADKAGKARPFLVLEYFAGSPLEDVVNREGPLSVADMTEVGRQAALGLQACHEAGLLHGRVSPEAVLVARQPGGWQAKVTDFYGRPPRGVPSHTIGFTTRNRTLLGASFVGTLQYAAPEQMGRLQGAVPGPASDIYGWGRTFCFGLFGRAEPGPNDWKSLPAGLGDLLEDCLAADPGARPANFAAVVARLPGCRV
jgi:serine/threonine protein kinase